MWSPHSSFFFIPAVQSWRTCPGATRVSSAGSTSQTEIFWQDNLPILTAGRAAAGNIYKLMGNIKLNYDCGGEEGGRRGRNKNHDILIVAQEGWKVLMMSGEKVKRQQRNWEWSYYKYLSSCRLLFNREKYFKSEEVLFVYSSNMTACLDLFPGISSE